MTALAERQAEFCSYFLPTYPMRSAAVIGGNATQENLCRPVTEGAKDHGSDGALQWRLERLDGPDGLKAWCAAKGLTWDSLRGQAFFTVHELTQPQYATLQADLKAGTKSIETLTLDFCDAFERPSDAGRVPDKRIGYAHDCLTILMRDIRAPIPSPIPAPTIPPIGVSQMPIETILQLIAPLAESLISGLLKGVLTHVQLNGVPASPASPVAVPPTAAPAMPAFDFIKFAEAVAAEIAKLQQGKPA